MYNPNYDKQKHSVLKLWVTVLKVCNSNELMVIILTLISGNQLIHMKSCRLKLL